YDTPTLGGTHGESYYFGWYTRNMELSKLLNGHDGSVHFNCSDNMGATTTMLAMMGVKNVRPLYLGPMTLRAIWGIGAPEYTTHLWPDLPHEFAYHHIVTRDGGAHVIDTCLQLDEDGDPNATPGIPGWNNDRSWSGR